MTLPVFRKLPYHVNSQGSLGNVRFAHPGDGYSPVLIPLAQVRPHRTVERTAPTMPYPPPPEPYEPPYEPVPAEEVVERTHPRLRIVRTVNALIHLVCAVFALVLAVHIVLV